MAVNSAGAVTESTRLPEALPDPTESTMVAVNSDANTPTRYLIGDPGRAALLQRDRNLQPEPVEADNDNGGGVMQPRQARMHERLGRP